MAPKPSRNLIEEESYTLSVEQIGYTQQLLDSGPYRPTNLWNCDGGCGLLHSAMAKLAEHIGYQGAYPEQAAEIAEYINKKVWMTMEIHNVES